MKSISDVVGAAGLHGYAEVALLIFFTVFIAVGIRVVFTRRAEMDRMARLPLDGEDETR